MSAQDRAGGRSETSKGLGCIEESAHPAPYHAETTYSRPKEKTAQGAQRHGFFFPHTQPDSGLTPEDLANFEPPELPTWRRLNLRTSDLYVARYLMARPRGHPRGKLDRSRPAKAQFIELDRGNDTREHRSHHALKTRTRRTDAKRPLQLINREEANTSGSSTSGIAGLARSGTQSRCLDATGWSPSICGAHNVGDSAPWGTYARPARQVIGRGVVVLAWYVVGTTTSSRIG